MKKNIFIAALLVVFGSTITAGELEATNAKSNQLAVGCTAGLTTCGTEFMVCDTGPDFTPEEAWIIYSNVNLADCGELP